MPEKSSFNPKKFAVIGAGPVGCIVAAFLARGGCDVTLCDVQAPLLEAAMEPGIILSGAEDFSAPVAKTTTRIDLLAEDPPDVVIVTVKATALPIIASALEGFIAGERYVVSWQNGIDTELVLAERLGKKQVMRAVVNYGCILDGPARVRLAFHHRPHYLQELDPQSRDAAVGICRALTEAGLDTRHTEQIRNMVWTKAVNNSCMNPVCAVTGKTMFEVINDPIVYSLVDALLKEGVMVARANELLLGPDFYLECLDYIKGAGHHKPSMLQDIEAGRQTEIDYLNGKIVEYGERAGVMTPHHRTLRTLVKALEARG
ncbi:ketopantoate reductase family protein [Geothermobacter hydrogeniphilus]|uniref:2-dehydropantoate 2-reductase n=1 Tax=Geothermobacter hydrogeniphilus TaxID=1969733 RepID=A0A1X0Y2B3_9BACT|nr:2-dehydropantoate 2-reductase [Geothermobacter hydrogeniphilus]ORJ59238.1 2-dehydropantoate 2-reductase [Geothermobacter hydrogeniphilus]